VPEAKKRGRGRGPEASHRLNGVLFIAKAIARLEAAHFRFRGSLWRAVCAHPHGRSASVELCLVEQSSTGVANAIPVCARRGGRLVAEAEVDRFSASAQVVH
jgi:hypothetical protein